MASEDYSKNGLLAYLRESAKSGVLNPAVARSRKVAALQLLDHISSEERLNLRLIDVDILCSRIHKLEESTIRVEALNLYNARLQSALTDYFSWLDDPQHFVSSNTANKNNQAQNLLGKVEQKALEDITLINTDAQSGIIPIPIRQDLTVFIKDLPIDLTQKEAHKIVSVIKAYASGEGDE